MTSGRQRSLFMRILSPSDLATTLVFNSLRSSISSRRIINHKRLRRSRAGKHKGEKNSPIVPLSFTCAFRTRSLSSFHSRRFIIQPFRFNRGKCNKVQMCIRARLFPRTHSFRDCAVLHLFIPIRDKSRTMRKTGKESEMRHDRRMYA